MTIRFWITQRRCEKTLQHLPATSHERLPVLHHPDHPMSKIGRHRMFVQLHRHPTIILVCICNFYHVNDRLKYRDYWCYNYI